MFLKTRGIVFRTIKYGESSVITTVFTEDKGLHSFIAGGVRAVKSKMPYNLFQPMTVLDMVSYFREDANSSTLHRIKELRSDYVFQSIPFDIKKGSIALFMAEICQKSIQESEENRSLFEYIFDTLVFLDNTQEPIANIHLHFLLGLSNYLGFQPEVERNGDETLYFDLKEGIFTETPPPHGNLMEQEDTARMLYLLSVPIEQCHELKMSRQNRKMMLHHLLRFYQLHVPGFADIHTPEVLEVVLE